MQVEKEVETLFTDVAKLLYKDPLSSSSYDRYGYNNYREEGLNGVYAKKRALAHALGTMKSARNKNIRDYFEFTNELIAQYIITGKVTLNKELPAHMVARHGQGQREYMNQGRKLTPQEKEDIEDVIQMAENTLNYYIEELINNSVGNIYVM